MDEKMVQKIIRSKLLIFLIQIIIIFLITFTFGYTFQITLPLFEVISPIRLSIIQTLGNLVLYNDMEGQLLIYGSWIVASIIPIIVYKDSRSSISANLKLMFFPNFFFYVFAYKYLNHYFEENFWDLFFRTLLLFSILMVISFIIPYSYNKIKEQRKSIQEYNLNQIATDNRNECPFCGERFNSNPLYCFNCSNKLQSNIKEKKI